MDWLRQVATWLREWLAQQAWLEGWQATIEATPDWALVAAGPGALLMLAILVLVQAPRGKRAAERPEKVISQPASATNAASAGTTTATSPRLTPRSQQPTTTVGAAPAELGADTPPAAALAVEQPASGVRRACGVPDEDEQDRAARVFLSSTFRDMRGEREVLATETFPLLKRAFRARGVEVREVDLRWGVNEGDPTLDICLAAVRRSNWFVGLIGQRYGTTLENAATVAQLAGEYPSVRDGLGRSLTELEILEGVLDNTHGDKHILFFERAPAWLDTLSPEARADYEETTPEAQAKLADLRARIRAKTGEMHLYASPQDIDAVFEARMTEALEEAFPPLEGADDPFVQEHSLHAAYARERLGLYVGGEIYLRDLDAWMGQGEAEPKIAVGTSGGGKSTLIAHWTTRWARAHAGDIVFAHYLGASPDSANPTALVRRLWLHLNRVTGEDGEPPSPDTELDDLREKISERLAQASAFAAREDARILIALDGLDKLSDEHRDLRWWPRVLPRRIRLLASSLDGKACDAGRERGWSELQVKPFDAAQQSAFIAETLTSWNKSDFPETRKGRILAHPLAGLPLFLKTILEELRVSAANDVLDQRLDEYLKASAMPDLFARILAQVETECGRELTAGALSLLWTSRAGLEEDEIVTIAGATSLAWERLRNRLADALRDHHGRIAFAHDYLRQAVEGAYLGSGQAKRAAHLAIADRFEKREPDLRQAEELPYQLRAAGDLGDDSAWTRLEALLTDLDRFKLLRAQGLGELVAYWAPLRARGRDVEQLLCEKFEARAGEPKYWSRDDTLLSFEIDGLFHYLGTVGKARRTLGARRIEACRRLASQNPENTQEQTNLTYSLFRMGEVSSLAGDLAAARACYEQSLEVAERLVAQNPDGTPDNAGARRDLSIALRALGDVAMTGGDLAQAKARHEQSLAVVERLAAENPSSIQAPRLLSTSFIKLGDVAMELHDYAAARARYEQALAIDERLVAQNPDSAEAQRNLLVSVVHLGNAAQRAGDIVQARARYEQNNALCERLVAQNPDSSEARRDLMVSLNKLGETALELNDYSDAQARFEQSLALAERITVQNAESALAQRDLSIILQNLGHVAMQAGDLTQARARYEQALAIGERITVQDAESALAQRDLSIILNKLGDVSVQAGDLVQARAHYEQYNALCEHLAVRNPESAEEQRNLMISTSKLGDVAAQLGDHAATRVRYEQSLAIAERLATQNPDSAEAQRDLLISLNNLGNVAMQASDLAQARARYEQSHTVAERLAARNPDNANLQIILGRSLGKLGDVALQASNLAEARARYEQSLAVAERLAAQNPDGAEAQDDLWLYLTKLGQVATELGDAATARARFEQSLAVAERRAAGNPTSDEAQRNLSLTLTQLGDVAMEADDLAAARALFERSLGIDERLAEQSPGNAEAQRDLLVSLIRIGEVAEEAGDLPGARAHYERSLAVAERLAAQQPESGFAQRDVWVSLVKLGDLAVKAGNLAEAIGRYEQSLPLAVALADATPDSAQGARDLASTKQRLEEVRTR